MIKLNKFLTLLNFATNSLPYVGLNIFVSVGMFTVPVCLTSQLTYLKLETKKNELKMRLVRSSNTEGSALQQLSDKGRRFSSRVHQQQLCVSRATNETFAFLR